MSWSSLLYLRSREQTSGWQSKLNEAKYRDWMVRQDRYSEKFQVPTVYLMEGISIPDSDIIVSIGAEFDQSFPWSISDRLSAHSEVLFNIKWKILETGDD
jgi:hypothetical protein